MGKNADAQNRREICLNTSNISIDDIVNVGRHHHHVKLTTDKDVRDKIDRACQFVHHAVEKQKIMYGINTNFGGLADELLPPEQVEQLQENLIWGLKCGLGQPLPAEVVRAAMFIRAHALSKGCSGIRDIVIERYLEFLNKNITPVVKELGSIGASGDLVPMAQIAGAVIGLDPSYQVHFDGKQMDCLSALKQIDAKPIALKAKEGLALVNSTAMMTAIASHCVSDAQHLFSLSLGVHALFAQALECSSDPFDAFVHQVKPHKGQQHVAEQMRVWLEGSKCVHETKKVGIAQSKKLVQDRYSIRCIPQFLGPVFEGLHAIQQQIEVEANSIDDNPIVDMQQERIVHSGNFMGQYISMSMDQLRTYFAIAVKHMDAQLSLVVSPEFNNGLPGSLAGNSADNVKFGLKGMQICANSIMPKILHLGNNMAMLFPTHAEQFNQNINSQGFNAANLSRQSIDLYKYYLSVSLLCATQACCLRSKVITDQFDASQILSKKTLKIYENVYKILGRQISSNQPLIFKNNEQALDDQAQKIYENIESFFCI